NNAKKDIDNKIIRFVGNAEDRILESKIRLLEGPVLIGTLGEGWSLDKETHDAIKKYHLKIVMAHSTHINREMNNLFKYVDTPSKVFNVLKSTKLIDEILPEFMLCNNIEQTNKKKGLTLQQHIMYALDSVTLKQTNHIELRLAALLHDIAKPHCYIETKTGMHFYNHENIGAILAERILYRWGYKKEIAKKVALLVKHHLFNASFRVSDSQISKLIAKVGPENIHDLLDLRIADRRGTGRKDISMKAVEQMRVRVNNALSTISPKTFKLALSNSELEKAIRFSTDNAKSAASDIKEYLKHKVLYGRLSNKPANLKRAIREINRIKCPLDKSHLFKTWSNIVKGSEEVFEDGKLKCGVYCEFICDKKRNK
ncbi:HD domain-containing protein, partial [bacterium]|nr:HD domain-containing protein [bacterium]